jgi:hypothetical protein
VNIFLGNNVSPSVPSDHVFLWGINDAFSIQNIQRPMVGSQTNNEFRKFGRKRS